MSLFAWRVFGTEVAATQDRHSHHSKIINRHRTHFDRGLLPGWSWWRAGHMEATVPFSLLERTVRTNGCRFDAWNVLRSFQQPRPKCILLFVRFVLRIRQCDFEVQHSVRIETEWGVLCMPKTFQRQSRTGEEYNCERDLRD